MDVPLADGSFISDGNATVVRAPERVGGIFQLTCEMLVIYDLLFLYLVKCDFYLEKLN